MRKQIQENNNINFKAAMRRIYYVTQKYISDLEQLKKDYNHRNCIFTNNRLLIYQNVISMYVDGHNYLKNYNYEDRKNVITLGLYMINHFLQIKYDYRLRRVEDRTVKK